jgi:hypothetical protein
LYPVGFKTFDATETHYLFYTAYAEDILFDLRRKVTSKGFGSTGVAYFATETTWKEFAKLTTWTAETKHMFEIADGFFTGRAGNQYIVVTDGEMPDGYVACLDINQKILYKREDDNPKFRGLYTKFGELGKNRAIEKADFKILNTGYGVQTRGAGAIAYIKSGATAYVSPTYFN